MFISPYFTIRTSKNRYESVTNCQISLALRNEVLLKKSNWWAA